MNEDERIGLGVPTREADIAVVNLGDRRRILALEAQVKDLGSRLAEALQRAKPVLDVRHSSCIHLGTFNVDDNKPEVCCAECGAVVDPYVVLRKLARREVNFCYSLNDLQKKQKELAKEVDTLRAAKSRLRRRVRGEHDVPPAGIVAIARELGLAALGFQRIPGGRWRAASKDLLGGVEEATNEDPELAISGLVELLRAKAAGGAAR